MNANRIHKTASGECQLIASWRDGQPPKHGNGIGQLTIRHDQTNELWRFTGQAIDAARVIATWPNKHNDGATIFVLNGLDISEEVTPDDFYIGVGDPDETGCYADYGPNFTNYPNTVAW